MEQRSLRAEEQTVDQSCYRDRIALEEEACLFHILHAAGLAVEAYQAKDMCPDGSMLPELVRSEVLGRAGETGSERLRLWDQICTLIGEIEAVAVRCLGQSICMGEDFLRGIFLTAGHTMLVTDVSGWRYAQTWECYVQAAASYRNLLRESGTKSGISRNGMENPEAELLRRICLRGSSLCGLAVQDFHRRMEKRAMELDARRRQREMMSRMTAVLVCGGKSSRMNYEPKQFLKIGRFTFLEHIYHQLGDFGEVALSYNGELPGYVVWEDIFPDRGPIGGIHAALSHAACPAVFFVACDMPGVTRECIGYLVEHLCEEDDCLVPVCDGREHPMCAIYRTGILAAVEDQIRREDYRLRDLLKQVRTRYLEMPEIYKNDFFNVNTPQMLEKQRENRAKKNYFSPVTFT